MCGVAAVEAERDVAAIELADCIRGTEMYLLWFSEARLRHAIGMIDSRNYYIFEAPASFGLSGALLFTRTI